MTQSSLWQHNKNSNDFAEVCNALYERELHHIATAEINTAQGVQGRLKSLSYYINKTADAMTKVNDQGTSPLSLDVQNATWSSKQSSRVPLHGEDAEVISTWYVDLLHKENNALLGLVVPVLDTDHIILDCIDAVNIEKGKLRTNVAGWFSMENTSEQSENNTERYQLLKPNKKVMLAACAGHRWQNSQSNTKLRPVIPSLRELLLSCSINWKNFHKKLS